MTRRWWKTHWIYDEGPRGLSLKFRSLRTVKCLSLCLFLSLNRFRCVVNPSEPEVRRLTFRTRPHCETGSSARKRDSGWCTTPTDGQPFTVSGVKSPSLGDGTPIRLLFPTRSRRSELVSGPTNTVSFCHLWKQPSGAPSFYRGLRSTRAGSLGWDENTWDSSSRLESLGTKRVGILPFL